MAKYFVDAAGKYIGGYEGADALKLVPAGAVEVPIAPVDARQTWSGTAWSDPALLPAPAK